MSSPACACAEWRVEYLAEYERQLAARFVKMRGNAKTAALLDTIRHTLTVCRLWCPTMRAEFDQTSFVYFIQVAGVGPIKVGTTGNVAQRVANMQCAHAAPLTVLSVTGGGERFERTLHEAFANTRVRGEWFLPTRSLYAVAYELDDREGRRREPEEVIEFSMNVNAVRVAA